MAVTAAAGIIGFGPQAGKTTTATTFYRHKAIQADLAVLDDTRLGDDEVGGEPIPTFPYKAGVTVGGGLTLQPRLESTLGWLLYGAVGKLTTSGTQAPYSHAFTLDSTDPSLVRWMSFRKAIPRKDNVATTDVGETYTDCKITNLALTLATERPVQARVDVQGRSFELDPDPTAWTWSNTFEDYQSIPVGTHTSGSITVAGITLPVVQATVSFQNQVLDPRMDRVYGSPFLEDITIVKRQLTMDLLVKWNDPELYSQVLTGSTNGTEWAAAPFMGALDLKTYAPTVIGTTTTNYNLRFEAPSVMLSMNGGITLAGGQAVMMRFNGVALDPSGAQEYVTVTLQNGVTSYTWPT